MGIVLVFVSIVFVSIAISFTLYLCVRISHVDGVIFFILFFNTFLIDAIISLYNSFLLFFAVLSIEQRVSEQSLFGCGVCVKDSYRLHGTRT